LHVLGVADLDPGRARAALARVGWDADRFAAPTFATALAGGGTHVGDDAAALIAADGLDGVIDATGEPAAGIRPALAAGHAGPHSVMVNVEADALAGPLLARRAASAGVVYSLAYGDQPALIAELVDWARAAGFDVVAAGKGTKYPPEFHASTPDTVRPYYAPPADQAAAGGAAAPGGLGFPPAGVDDLPRRCRPRAEGGALDRKGQVEVVSSLERDGTPVARDLRWGVYVVVEAPNEYVARCFGEYGLVT